MYLIAYNKLTILEKQINLLGFIKIKIIIIIVESSINKCIRRFSISNLKSLNKTCHGNFNLYK